MATKTDTAAARIADILKGHADYIHALDAVLDAPTLDAVPRATWETLDDDREEYGPRATGRDVFRRWMDYVLDVTVLTDPRPGRDAHTVRVLVECGGPRVEYRRDHDDGETVEILATWSPETGTRRVWAPRVAAALDQLAGAY